MGVALRLGDSHVPTFFSTVGSVGFPGLCDGRSGPSAATLGCLSQTFGSEFLI